MKRTIIAYGIAGAALAAALLLRWLLDPLLGNTVPFVTLFGAVAVAVWTGGVSAALVVTFAGYLVCVFLFVEPRGQFNFHTREVVALGAYLVTCSIIIWLCAAMRRAQHHAELGRQTLRVTLASMGDALICTDEQGRITAINQVAETLTGWTQAEALGVRLERVFRIVNEQTRETVESPAERALREGVIVGLANHTVLISKDGTDCPIDDSAAPIRDETGNVRGCVLTFRDVRQRREMERQLEARLAASYFLASIVKSSQDAIVSKTLDGVIRSWNASAERLLGYSSDEAVGRHISLIIPRDRLAEEEQIIARLRNRERVEHFETIRLRKDGLPVHVSLTISPIEDDAGRVVGASKIIRDITDRAHAEAALQLRSTRLRLLAESAEIMLSTRDADTMLRRLHAKLSSPLGIDACLYYVTNEAADALNLACGLGLPDEVLPSLQELRFGQGVCGAVAQSRQRIQVTDIQQSTTAMTHSMRSTGIQAYVCAPLISEGTLLGTLSFASRSKTAFDSDELILLDAIASYMSSAYERLKLVSELREADRRKDEFLATLAHELRNPLAPLGNSLEILQRAEDDADVRRQALATMNRQLAQLVRLVDDLLDVSRITRDRLTLRMQSVALAAVVESAVEACRPMAARNNQALSVCLPAEPLPLQGDPVRLSQVLTNLLHNACKYTPAGGRITLEATRDADTVIVSVSDTGIGIPAAKLGSVFDMFAQIDDSLERSHGGLGIGLSLARRLVKMHGGSIAVASGGPGLGTRFTVTLPVAQDNEQLSAVPESPLARPGEPLRVLIVDDNHDSAISLSMLLDMSGHVTRVVHDGLEAVESAAQFNPDVVLLDIGLPTVNGYEVCKRIRAETWGAEMLLVAVTGWGQAADRARSQAAGFDEHLVKPVDFTTLENLLSQVRSRHR